MCLVKDDFFNYFNSFVNNLYEAKFIILICTPTARLGTGKHVNYIYPDKYISGYERV